MGAGYNNLIGCRTLSTPSGPPFGTIDGSSLSMRTATLQGWAIDPDTPASIDIHAYVNGAWGGAFPAADTRADVARAYPGYGDRNGFAISVAVPVGMSSVCLYAINQGVGYNRSIGCRTVTTASGPPTGNLESVTATAGGARLTGWVIDPDTPDPVTAHLYVDDRWGGAYLANAPRPDVGRAYPGYGDAHGIAIDVALPVGTHRVCAYAIDVPGGLNPLLGCRTVTVAGGPPFGSLDAVTPGPGTIALSGWAIDPDTPDPIQVHVYVDGAWGGSYLADADRPDVGRAYPAAGSKHGYAIALSVPSGRHDVCVYAINVGSGYNTLIRCAVADS